MDKCTKFFFTLFLTVAACLVQLQAQSASTSTASDADVEALIPRYVKVTVSPVLRDGAVVVSDPVTLHMNEMMFLWFVFSAEPNVQFDEKFVLSNADKIDNSILQYADMLSDRPWIPKTSGKSVTIETQVKWHDRGRSVRGVPIIVDKTGPSKVETIRVTVNVVE